MKRVIIPGCNSESTASMNYGAVLLMHVCTYRKCLSKDIDMSDNS